MPQRFMSPFFFDSFQVHAICPPWEGRFPVGSPFILVDRKEGLQRRRKARFWHLLAPSEGKAASCLDRLLLLRQWPDGQCSPRRIVTRPPRKSKEKLMKSEFERSSLRRLAALLLTALSIASCGGGSSGSTPVAATVAAAPTEAKPDTPAISAETRDAAAKVSAGGGQNEKAVGAALASLQAFRADRIQQVVVFGDSLSDVGTYKVGSIAQVGGGKFTTNPGPVWPETVGLLLGTTVKPFRQGFGGASQVSVPLATGFAMGGARVSQQPGYGCDPDPSGNCTAALAIPVAQQIADFLTYFGSFQRQQMVFVFAGSNDFFYELDRYARGLQTGQQTHDAIVQAADTLAAQLHRIVVNGGSRIAVLTVPDITDTIAGRKLDSQTAAAVSGWVAEFNAAATAGLDSAIKIIDTHAEFKRVVANPGAFGVSVLDRPACDFQAIAELTGQLVQNIATPSLFCSALTLVGLNAPSPISSPTAIIHRHSGI
ncbi:SGNH/GDSL hydrolase family protein [Variovorax humicola]|uniref:SGNH/GDSL hydrolase family protein n=1 Tax=Variovorax humicola TaxID=1769758 RepID=A0ABU8W462_9BURK